jgi:ArsR family transcriptional regulator
MNASAIDLKAMTRSAARATRLVKALANPDRLILLCQLAQREMCVGDLEKALGIVQPTLSQQLTVLRRQRLVVATREGKRIFYRLSSPEALALIEVLYRHYCVRGASRGARRPAAAKGSASRRR